VVSFPCLDVNGEDETWWSGDLDDDEELPDELGEKWAGKSSRLTGGDESDSP
jgi:hypothetical protein